MDVQDDRILVVKHVLVNPPEGLGFLKRNSHIIKGCTLPTYFLQLMTPGALMPKKYKKYVADVICNVPFDESCNGPLEGPSEDGGMLIYMNRVRLYHFDMPVDRVTQETIAELPKYPYLEIQWVGQNIKFVTTSRLDYLPYDRQVAEAATLCGHAKILLKGVLGPDLLKKTRGYVYSIEHVRAKCEWAVKQMARKGTPLSKASLARAVRANRKSVDGWYERDETLEKDLADLYQKALDEGDCDG